MKFITLEAAPRHMMRQMGALTGAAVFLEYEPGEIIFEEGSAPDGLYLVMAGEVDFRKRFPDGHDHSVSCSRAGEYFGEIALLTGHTRSLRAVAHGQTTLARIPTGALVDYLKRMPGPIENLLQSLIRHLHETTAHYIEDMVRQEKMAMIGTMINTVIHDFKNPFCLISLSAQLIEQASPDAKIKRYSHSIREQVDRMVMMAADLSEFSRGQQKLQLGPVNLRQLMGHFQALNSPFFQTANIVVRIDVPELVVAGESSKLLRVLENLVGNAIEAIGEGPGRIDIAARPDKPFVLMTVSDNGPGIPESIRHRLWDPFVTYGKSQGNGLGTAIVKSIVEAHQGSVTFETATGQGTRFLIRIPLYKKPAASPRGKTKRASKSDN